MKLDSKFLVGALTALSLFAPACGGDAKKEEPKKEEAKPEEKKDEAAKPEEKKDEAKPEEKKDEAAPEGGAEGEKKDEAAPAE